MPETNLDFSELPPLEASWLVDDEAAEADILMRISSWWSERGRWLETGGVVGVSDRPVEFGRLQPSSKRCARQTLLLDSDDAGTWRRAGVNDGDRLRVRECAGRADL